MTYQMEMNWYWYNWYISRYRRKKTDTIALSKKVRSIKGNAKDERERASKARKWRRDGKVDGTDNTDQRRHYEEVCPGRGGGWGGGKKERTE